MNVLVLAPHPDDEAIGCGGAVVAHVQQGDRVAVVFLTSGELGLKHLAPEAAWRVREAEAEAAAAVLGVARLDFLRRPDWTMGDTAEVAAAMLHPLLCRDAPEVVYAPHEREWHPDHRATVPVLRAALRGGPQPARVRAYEVWTPIADPDHVEDISSSMPRKLRAVRCYRSQLADLRYDRAVRGLGAYRGALAGRCRFAEVFQHVNLGARSTGPAYEDAAVR